MSEARDHGGITGFGDLNVWPKCPDLAKNFLIGTSKSAKTKITGYDKYNEKKQINK